ncbi:MAG: SDR family NAD(P)-dependent oxidoreductase [Anaerolineae bacterium]
MGRAIARAYVEAGMRVALMDVQVDKLQQLADELTRTGADCLPIVVDLADEKATQVAVQQAIDHYGVPACWSITPRYYGNVPC